MRSAHVLGALAAGAAAFAMTRPALALGPVGVEVGAKAGIGTNPVSTDSNGDPNPNPMGFGIGARAGVSIFGLYGGAQIMYYFGSSEGGETGSISAHTLMYGLEGGYNLSLLGLVTVRPQVGVGNATLTYSNNLTGLVSASESGSQSSVYIEPGLTVLVSVVGWYVGADANLLFLPGINDSTTGFTFHGQVGMKF